MGGAGLVFLALFFAVTHAFAQSDTRYVDLVNGADDDACDWNRPCTLSRAWAQQTNDDQIFIRVRRAGGTVQIPAPATSLTKNVTFATYVPGGVNAVEGTLEFTGNLKIASTGQFILHSKAKVQFEDITLESGDRSKAVLEENQIKGGIAITGTLTIPDGETALLINGDFTVSRSFTVKGGMKGGQVSRLRIIVWAGKEASLTVQRGATLRMDGADLAIHLRGELIVDGAIEDVTKDTRRSIWLVFLNASSGQGTRGRFGATEFIKSSLYRPRSRGVDRTDCRRVLGTGAIHSEIVAIAMGNVCVELKRVGPVTVTGSLSNDANTGNPTTDLIFREDVVVNGDVAQWNDSRIVFEKTATIKGDVLLQDGGIPYTNTSGYGQGNIGADTGVRVGWKVKDNEYTCAYSSKKRRDEYDYAGGAYHIPGVQFEGTATIEGDLNVYSNTLTETTTAATKAATRCAPRVLFMAPLAKTSGDEEIALTSSVGGSLVVEDTVSFGGKGRVYLDTDSLKTGAITRRTAHNVQVGGDLAAGGKTLGMAYPAMSSMDGMCTGKDTSLPFGNRLVLTDATESVIIGDATNGLTLDALVTLGDLRVESGKGPLTVATLHVGPDAELTANKDVKVTESLILQGELSGELDEMSTIRKLTYGNRTTDLVKKAALADMLDALSIQVGSGEVRLEEVRKVKNLGLCSGTLSLVDVESTTDSTLHVTGQITVENGMLRKDSNDPGSISTDKAKTAMAADRYLLKYITPGKREVTEGDLEWFDPRDVVVEHAKAEIMVPNDRSLPGKLEVLKGKLTVDGTLTVGTYPLDRASAAKVDSYSLVLTAGELQTEGQDVVVHGKVTVSGKSKFMTGGGDLHVLGRVSSGRYIGNTARVTVEKEAVIDLGAGTLMLGPEDTAKRDGLASDQTTAQVDLVLTGQLLADTLHVPPGSKRTHIVSNMSSKVHTSTLPTVLFNGRKTPNARLTNNVNGKLFFNWVEASGTDTGTTTVIDSLAVMHGGYVGFHGKKVEIMKDVHLRSGQINVEGEALEFKGDLELRGTNELNVKWDNVRRSMLIHGDFTQANAPGTENPYAFLGMDLGNMTTKTVMGDLVVGPDTRYRGSSSQSNVIVHGDVRYAYGTRTLEPTLEFKGEASQMVTMSANPKVAFGDVIVHNPKGILLGSDVRQGTGATLTLRQGKVHSTPVDSMYTWTVQNVQVEEDLRGRLSAQEGNTCGSDSKQTCKASILRGSRQSYAVTPVVRHILQGTAGTGGASGGYLFPVGMEHKTDQDTLSYYRPLILQLPSDLNDTTAVTVTPVMVPDGEMLAWPAENITVPHAGGSLTLDVHAPIFWKIDLGEELSTNTNLRVAADGIRNVTDITGLRIVQWDCEWKHPKLAGRLPAQAEASSFAVNGYINGVVNLTQEGIGLGSCAIFGIAADGSENPIDQADLSGGRAMVQFIHNVPAPGSAPMEIDLGEVRISNNLRFRTATAYRPVGAGETQDVTIQPVGAPAAQAITDTVSLTHGRNYAVIVHGSLADPKLKVLDMRMTSSVATKAEVRLVHGSADLGAAQVQVMDSNDPMMSVMTLAGNLMLDEVTRRYIALNPSVQVMQVKSADGEVEEFYELDLYGYGGQTLVLNLSGMRNDLTILGVDRNGEIVPVQTVTGVEESAELPKEFALHGNYPNPFNPSTRIQFDLPENAQVQIQIVDMLGREVITLPAQEFEAGANRSVELQATSLASGTYLYRLIATGVEHRHVKTGRMTLVK